MTDALHAEGLHKRFGPVQALRGVSLTIPAGITYGLLGPSGSGKTTLIRLLLGLGRPDAGSVAILGHAMPDRRALSAVGYMPQASALYPDLTAWENVSFFARVQGVKEPDRVRQALELVQLASRAGDPVYAFSGGMLRRTSLACALVHGPRLLFLDEPTVGLDPLLRLRFWEHFRRLNAEGVTILLTSHMMEEAEHADRLGLLRAGTLLAEGSPVEICAVAGTSDLQAAFLRLAEQQGE